MKTRKEQLAMVDNFYWRCQKIAESGNHWDKYLAQIRQEEKGHRRFCPSFLRCDLSLGQAVRLFAVTDLLRTMAGEAPPNARDFLSIRTAMFMGYAIYISKQDEFQKEFSPLEAQSFMADVDYAFLNADQRQEAK